MPWLLGAGITLVVSLLLTPLVRSVARARGVVAEPSGDRWHRQPTALLGGVAIYAGLLVGCLVFAHSLPPGSKLILFAATIIFLAGLIDDLKGMSPPVKLVVQLVVAAVAVYFGRRLPWTGSQTVNIFITIFWLVGITNAINLLDNMDGLAGGISLISCLFLTITFLLNGQSANALLPAMLGGAVLGFLFFNFKPASIFMGDCGSMFLGFAMGELALLSNYDRTRNVGSVLLTPVLLLLIPILDTCLVTITRKLDGRPVSQGGRDHSSHRLVALGVSEGRAVLLLCALSAVSGLVALQVRGMKLSVMLPLVAGFMLVILFIGLYLGRVRVYQGDDPTANNTIVNVLADFTHKRRVFEILLDVVLVALAYNWAYALRFDGNIPSAQMVIFLKTLPLVIAIQMSFFLLCGAYRGIWRYAGMADLTVIAKAVASGVVATATIVFLMFRFNGPSRAIFILDGMLLLLMVGASRVSFRMIRTMVIGKIEPAADARPVLIYGAGDGGELLLRELLNNAEHRFAPVAFIDDDPRKVGKLIHGYQIHSSEELPDLIRRHGVNDVVVSSIKVPESRIGYLREFGITPGRLSIRIE